jgi:predicted Rossmann fold nucleotide-binding protein DprA/Smf involved in DNA uptake
MEITSLKTIIRIHKADPIYPGVLMKYLGDRASETISTLGNIDILKLKVVAFFCSVRCPGTLILKTFDYIRSLKDSDMALIGGFHSPMEKECLNILFRGETPIIICLARSLQSARLPKSWTSMIQEGQMLILSPFPDRVKRMSAKTSMLRNEFIAALSDTIFVPYASPGGKTDFFCRNILQWGKHLFTFDAQENAHLISLGVQVLPDCLS